MSLGFTCESHQLIYLIYLRTKDVNGQWVSGFAIRIGRPPLYSLSTSMFYMDKNYGCNNQIHMVGFIGLQYPYMRQNQFSIRFESYKISTEQSSSRIFKIYKMCPEIYNYFFGINEPNLTVNAKRCLSTYDELIQMNDNWESKTKS